MSKTDLSVIFLVSGAMMLKLVKTLDGSPSIDFCSSDFDTIVKPPLEIATYLCLAIYLFQCGRNYSKDIDLCGRTQQIPMSLLFAMFSVGNAPFHLKTCTPTMKDKFLGMSALYSMYIFGKQLSKKSCSIEELQTVGGAISDTCPFD